MSVKDSVDYYNSSDSVDYYNLHAEEFIESTVHVDMSDLYERFERLVPAGCRILDLGCGSGRDSHYFKKRGYDVVAADPSAAMCNAVKALVDIPVYRLKAEELEFENEFDAVWACASLLHVTGDDQAHVLRLICRALRDQGVVYASWKYGDSDREEGGRYFTDLDEASLARLLMEVPEFECPDCWISTDMRDDKRSQRWLNVLLRKR